MAGRIPLRRRLLAMAATALCTAGFMLVSAEVLARWLWPRHSDPSCLMATPRGHLYRPNCERTERITEGRQTIVYRYNSCGMRGTGPCAEGPPNGVRIALLGNSFGAGNRMNQPDSLAEVMTGALGKQCRGGVDLQNLSVEDYSFFDQYFRLDAALKLRPAVVVVLVMPTDLFEPIAPQELDSRTNPDIVRKSRIPTTDESGMSLVVRLRRLIGRTRILEVTQHYLVQNLPLYVRLYQSYSGVANGDAWEYLRPTPPPSWERRYADVGLLLKEMAAKTRQSGARLVLVALPQRVQAALLEMPADPTARASAFAYSERMRAIAAADDVTFIDGLGLIAGERHPSRLFYPVDGHLTVAGNRLVGEKLAQALLSAGIARDGGQCR